MNEFLQSAAGAVCLVITVSLIGCASGRYERTLGQYADDRTLGRQVKAALDNQPVYKFPDVKVNVFRNVVQLSGFVASDVQMEAATEIARRIPGVARVENNILLAPLGPGESHVFVPGREPRGDTNQVDRAIGAPGTGDARETGRDASERR